FADEISPIEIKSKKGVVSFAKDEHNRPETTVEGLKKLPKVFKKDGVVHAGAASGISDGAGSLVMSTRSWAEKKGLKPLGRLVNWASAGCDPKIMGIGPAPAIHAALKRANMTLDDVDLFEINEAFAGQILAVCRELKLDVDKLNVNGGAIALGHPLGASGSRLLITLLKELRRRGGGVGVASACIGGGQGIAMVVEAAA
ncbi:MAG: thiolase family protein, partial [Thermoanaerobaculia bacterium]